MLELEVTSNCDPDTADKAICVWLHFYVFGFYMPLINKCIYCLKVVRLLLKHPVYVRILFTDRLAQICIRDYTIWIKVMLQATFSFHGFS
jgi:hypothetical protein